MTDFPIHDSRTAPHQSKPLLEAARQKNGFVPNLLGVMAGSPALLGAYVAVSEQFERSRFSPTERQVVLLSASHENGCGYCVAAHSRIAERAKVPSAVIGALRSGQQIPDAKLEALRRFARTVVARRSRPDDPDIEAFFEAGYDRGHVLDVLAGIGMKTLSNYANHIASIPLDAAFESKRWKEAS